MKRKSIGSYSFHSADLNKVKKDLLTTKAVDLRAFRRELSLIVTQNPVEFLNIKNKHEFTTKYRRRIDSCNNQDISNSIEEVYVAYQNKKDKFIDNVNVTIQKEPYKPTYYKKKTKNHNVGDLKSNTITHKNTDFTKAVSYLTKIFVSKEKTLHFLNVISETTESESFKKFVNKVLYYLNHEVYGERVFKLCEAKQKRIINNVFKEPINFDSLTYTSCTEQKQQIIDRNEEKGSIYGAIITLSGQNTEDGKIRIPVKWSKKHHGDIKDYHKQPNKKNQVNVSYTVCFDEKQNIRIILTKEVERETVIGKKQLYGVDVNIKHNMYSDKNENIIDYDRNILKDYISFLKKCDIKLSKKPKGEKVLSNRDKKTLRKWNRRIDWMVKYKSHLLVEQVKELGYDHIVMEDLGLFGKGGSRSKEYEGFKYNRLGKLLGISNFKNIVGSIANKNGVQLSLVHAAHTSNGCEKCGHIHKANRKTQEEFKCVSCGHSQPADAHSCVNMEQRLLLDVLRKSTLICKDGEYRPKPMKRAVLKEIIHECYDSTDEVLSTWFDI